METINDLVGINNLKIYQNDDWFKFSLESVLLPYFVTINMRCKKILDLCTGNAPIPLILSTRTKALIYGVEIQEDVYELAKKSVAINNLSSQIHLINDNINHLKKYFTSDEFDVVTVNPPYFSNLLLSTKNMDEHKAIARHEVKTNLNDICEIASFLLKNNGYFAMIHRTERFFEVVDVLNKYHLTPKRIQFIYPKIGSSSNLFMIECIKNGHNGVIFNDPLYIHNLNGTYKAEIKKIFNII